MDRPSHSFEPDRRAPLRLNAVDWAIYAIVALCTVGAWAFTCTRASDVGHCMRDGAPALLGVLLQAAILVFAIWTGSELGRRSRSVVAGLASGAALFLVLSALLSWLGLSPLH
jgi:hypothetical protein